MTNYTQNGPQKKVYRWRHRAELVNQGATLVFWSFLCCLGEWLHNALCFHLLLMCAPDMLHPFQLGSDLPWLTMTYRWSLQGGARIETPEPINILKLWDPHTQCHWEERVSMLVWIACALRPVASPCAHWRRSTPNGKWKRKCHMQPGSDISTTALDSANPKSVKWPHWWRKASLASSDRTQVQT